MIKVIERIFPISEQRSFLEKITDFRESLQNRKPIERKLLGQTMTSDGITYLIAILCKCI